MAVNTFKAKAEVMRQDENDVFIEDDLKRLQEGKAWLAQRGGKGIPMEEVLADFGLTLEDFPLNQ